MDIPLHKGSWNHLLEFWRGIPGVIVAEALSHSRCAGRARRRDVAFLIQIIDHGQASKSLDVSCFSPFLSLFSFFFSFLFGSLATTGEGETSTYTQKRHPRPLGAS